MWTYNICAFDTARTIIIIDKITIFCNDANKTSTSVELLAIPPLLTAVLTLPCEMKYKSICS